MSDLQNDEDYDAIEEYLWQQKRYSDEMAKYFRDMCQDLKETFDEIDN